MNSKKSIRWQPLLLFFALSLLAWLVAAYFSRTAGTLYRTLIQPPFAPPGWSFPVVWPILYILLAISAYLVFVSDSKYRKSALILYGVQLFMNAIWPLWFFRLQLYFVAVVWIASLWFVIEGMIFLFFLCRRSAGFLQIPYFLWGSLAGYLTLGVWLLNR
ncbi:TspO/MBR family protein [Clostridium minihomine]|uniref:TspO/MBR family protein n=1 Tax=Clostridium minihomine TaxID=2045012 RepID=UPI000C76BCF5|nr:TspO/MBR family protein [Clostridium minihomine]